MQTKRHLFYFSQFTARDFFHIFARQRFIKAESQTFCDSTEKGRSSEGSWPECSEESTKCLDRAESAYKSIAAERKF